MSLKETIRIMVVDDMSTSRGILTNSLRQMGIKNVTFETDGEAALRKLVVNPVHLVISDYNMPKMDGLGLLKGLRENKTTQKIGFIMVTGSEDGAVVSKGQQLGMNNYLKKPVTPESLQKSIEKITGKL